MAGFFDRLGKAAQQTAAESRIRLEIHNLGSRLNDQAQALGLLMFSQHQGETVAEEEYTKLLNEMSQTESQRKAKEAELEELRRPLTAGAPAPSPAAPAPAPAPAAASAACPSCGAASPAGAKFCLSCGNKLQA